jgi:hypothetical protein
LSCLVKLSLIMTSYENRKGLQRAF